MTTIDADSPADVERKMRVAFSPLKAMVEGWNRAFVPGHRPRDPQTGRVVLEVKSPRPQISKVQNNR